MRIAVDAMGGDFAPREVVAGAVQAARELPSVTDIYLVGDEEAVKAELSRCGDIPDNIHIKHASQVVEMDEAPALAIRRKRDSSIGRAVDMVKAGEADAVMSAGNTGAVVAASTLKLRTLEGIGRPAIATAIPTSGRPLVLLDAGANPDCNAKLLCQFAVMGSVYSRIIFGAKNPVVRMLSIGGEESKGNEITKEAFAKLQKSELNFCGNMEGHDLFTEEVDVAVCDGFVGNVVLKTMESTAKALGGWMKEEFKKNIFRIIGCMFLSGALKSIKRRVDPEGAGGAPLLGVNGICIIAHGGSSRRAIFNAIRVASESVHNHLNEEITAEIKKMDAIT
jgi:glycerol-3-phosphate acyltransferase PlsX